MKRIRPAILLALVLSIPTSTSAQQPASPAASAGTVVSLTPQFPQQVLNAVDLVDQSRYGDAIDIANDLCGQAPDSAVARQLRGTLELWMGDPAAARLDFEAAEAHDANDAATHLGIALCAMRSNDIAIRQSTVPSELARASSCAGVTPEQSADIADIGAYYKFVLDEPDALAGLGEASPDDSVRAELLALGSARLHDKSAADALTSFLTTKSGVPRVREDEGLRLIFTERPTMLEPTITDPAILSMYKSRLTQPRMPDPSEDTANPIWGTVTLGPEQPNPATISVSLTIDDQPIATVTKAPYTYAWNTRLVLNGVHTVRLVAYMDGGGVVDREVKQIRVSNPADAIVGTSAANMDPAVYQQIQSGLWGLLRPRPSRCVAEMALARIRASEGDRADAETHNLIATALDPWLASVMNVSIHRLQSVEAASRHMDANDGVWYGNTNKKWVCLTFDDGPNAKTSALLDALDRTGIHATFFIVGSRAEERPEVVRRMAKRGDDVENHSYTHPNIAQCLPAMVESEVIRTNIIIRSLTGRYPSFFRPPGGNASRTLAALAGAYGLKLAFWSLDVLKFEEASSKPALVKYVLGHVHPGSIVLMHNGPDVTTAALPDIVDGLHKMGYKIVTLREIVK